jgi:hypothetical protein
MPFQLLFILPVVPCARCRLAPCATQLGVVVFNASQLGVVRCSGFFDASQLGGIRYSGVSQLASYKCKI